MSTDHILLIQHIPDSDPPRFLVVRQPDGRSTEPVALPSPARQPLPGSGGSRLLPELRWYLEAFLDYPFPPETERAALVCQALRQWGEAAFEALFGRRDGGRFFDAAAQDDYARLRLAISSDSPDILAWPWEALRDPEVGCLAHTCQIERRLNHPRDPAPLSDALSRDRVRILLVTARPRERDVPYRSVSRRLVELIARERLPAEVTVLRPPTFEALRRHLRAHPDTYHVLHFDGHGTYRDPAALAAAGAVPDDAATIAGAQGCLVFEDEHGAPDPKRADQLGVLLRDYRLPAVVLNACQSGMISDTTGDVFASVATALLQAGVRNVLAMRYSLRVHAAQVFLPAFYRRLFESGRFAEATRAGRQELLARPDRPSLRGMFPLEDWIVPVLYEQAARDPLVFAFDPPAAPAQAPPGAMFAMPAPSAPTPALPAALDEPDAPAGFVGRDGELLSLERALHRAPAGLLVHGLAGAGKTALARAFARWLVQTDGVAADHVLWLRLDELPDDPAGPATRLLDRMGRPLFGDPFVAASREHKLHALTDVMRTHRFLVVWDQFDRVSLAPDPAASPSDGADRTLLADFLTALRGGQTKVLITSRSDEPWLDSHHRFQLGIDGLTGEERWELATVLLRDLGRAPARDDADLSALLDALQGHPQAMSTLVPALERHSARALLKALSSPPEALADLLGSRAHALLAPVRAAEHAVPEALRPLHAAVALHTGLIQTDRLAALAAQVDPAWTRPRVNDYLAAMTAAGLLHPRRGGDFALHPLLTATLRARSAPTDSDPWARAFLDAMTRLAAELRSQPPAAQRAALSVHAANLYTALTQAARLGARARVRRLLALIAEPTVHCLACLRSLHRQAAASEREAIAAMWAAADLGPFPLDAS